MPSKPSDPRKRLLDIRDNIRLRALSSKLGELP
jgi:hypothetical protein